MDIKEKPKKAYQKVIEYEKDNRRIAYREIKNIGYDISSKGKNQIRHIEVKATSRETPHFRFLTEKEFITMTHDKHYYLYIVCNIDAKKPGVYEFNQNEILKRFKRVEPNYVISFSKDDFKKHKKRKV